MKISVLEGLNGGFEPQAGRFLDRLPPSRLFHEAQQLRHPAAIYFLSLEKLCKAFTRVLNAHEAKRHEYRFSNGPGVDLEELLREQENLLRNLQEHLDDCYLILKTLVDPRQARKTPLFADKYVVENKLPGAKAFQDSCTSLKSSLLIANKLKHQQGLLQGVLVTPGPHLGYYLETPSLNGALGPSPEVHPDQGCFSFARDLPLRLLRVYQCSAFLVNAASKATNQNTLAAESTIRDRVPVPWEGMLKLMEKLPNTVFPKEILKGLPTFRRDLIAGRLVITHPDSRAKALTGYHSVSLKLIRDGYSDKILPPHP